MGAHPPEDYLCLPSPGLCWQAPQRSRLGLQLAIGNGVPTKKLLHCCLNCSSTKFRTWASRTINRVANTPAEPGFSPLPGGGEIWLGGIRRDSEECARVSDSSAHLVRGRATSYGVGPARPAYGD